MNKLLTALKEENTHILTENGGNAYSTTLNKVLDMFSFGGAYRSRSDEDCILLFKQALEEDESLAMKCLFYLRNIRGGQGERRFFRICYHWLAKEHPEIAERNMKQIAEFGRWDDLYCLVDTPLEQKMFKMLKETAFQQLQFLQEMDKNVEI